MVCILLPCKLFCIGEIMMSEILGRIHSTESFGTVDGPGIRFVIFMQGCPIRCAYCHNPDTWSTKGGILRSVNDLLQEYDTYKEFLKGGGITVTGGEPLLQMEFVTQLFQQAKEKNIHTCLDTSGITFNYDKREQFDELMKVTDLVMLDIKQINEEKHKKLTGQSNRSVLAFAKYLSENKIPLWVRYVAVESWTDDETDLTDLGSFLARLTSLKALDVLPYHTMGKVKYDNLSLPYRLEGVPAMEKERAIQIRECILNAWRAAK